MQADQTEPSRRVTDADVLKHLTENPGFFEEFDGILPRLRIPHRSGSATSLIERQVRVLRERCETLEGNLRDFITVARENELLNGRMHELVQDIVSARSLKQVLGMTQDSLANNFNADGVFVLLAGQAAKPDVKRLAKSSKSRKAAAAKPIALPEGTRILRDDHPMFSLFDELFESGETLCGMPGKERLAALAGEQQANVASAALIPLQYKRRLGVIMLTSRDVERFASGKGVMFLDQFGGLLSRRLQGMRIVAADDSSADSESTESLLDAPTDRAPKDQEAQS